MATRDADAQPQFDGSRVSGSGGCNRVSGPYQRTGHRLTIGPLAATRMACIEPERGAMESSFFAALQATTGYSRLGSQLTLLDDSGRTLAVLTAAERDRSERAQPVSRSSASRYLAAVFSMISAGRRGAGGVLSQGLPLTLVASSQSRTNCLS